MDLDPNVIRARLKKLDEYQRSLLRFQNLPLDEYAQDEDIQAIVERRLQLAIQACIDIASYLIARERFKVPDDEPNVFLVLSQESIIDSELARRMKGMVNFRNILIHEYLDIDHEVVHHHLTHNLEDLDRFAKAIVEYLDRRASENRSP